MDHVTVMARVAVDDSGFTLAVPMLVTTDGPIESLLDYTLDRLSIRSGSWLSKLTHSVSLLLDYLAVNKNGFSDPAGVLGAFITQLRQGSIASNGIDPSGLYWAPRSAANVNQVLGFLTQFSDWLEEKQRGQSLNPKHKGDAKGSALAWFASQQRTFRMLLAHTANGASLASMTTRVHGRFTSCDQKYSSEATNSFPDGQFSNLIRIGLGGEAEDVKYIKTNRLRDILITILLNCGGIRVSEAFHIYCHDVIEDPLTSGSAWVRVYHPSIGKAPNDFSSSASSSEYIDRSRYLREKYAMQERNAYKGTHQIYAGWKGSLLDHKDNFFNVHWFPTYAGRVFWCLWLEYMMRRARLDCRHPFAFVTKQGEPYSVKDYMEAHSRAVNRIGLDSNKQSGTTPHGHRHAYGQRLADLKVPPIYRKKALHHISIESQVVYTEPSRSKLNRLFEEATSKHFSDGSVNLANLLSCGFRDVDPLGLFSGPHPKFDGVI